MVGWDFPRGVASVALLAGFAEELGQSRADVLRGSGLEAAVLRDPSAQVSAEQELTVVRNLVAGQRTTGRDPGELGLAVGARYHATSYGIWGYAVTSCATVRAAVELALRYIELTYVFCIPELRTDGQLAELRCRDEDVPSDVRSFLIARDLAAIMTLTREQAGAELRPTAVRLALPEPPDRTRYREAFGVEPQFAAGSASAGVTSAGATTAGATTAGATTAGAATAGATAMMFPHAILAQPMPQASEHTLAWCERQCRDLVEARRAGTDVTTRVRRALVDHGPGAGMGAVAAVLSMTERTLRRRLADEGAGFREIADGVRRQLAGDLLADEAWTVERIAHRLGYSEPSSFIHAFTRWHGMSPREFRRRNGSVRPTGGH